MELNARAWRRCERLLADAQANRVEVSTLDCGTRLVDCGVQAAGGLEAGRALAEICLADLGRVEVVAGRPDLWPGPMVQVTTDQPVLACLASQYAGWKIAGEKFFAMGSGPMRAAYGHEAIFGAIGFREHCSEAVGVLESDRLPRTDVCQFLAEKCGVTPDNLTLLVARTASLAGSLQIVARSVETALHKLHELHFDVRRIRNAFGTAPLPPVALNDLHGIGRTNDAVLYGADVTLWVEGDDDSIHTIGPQTPSSSSRDYGRPFLDVFRGYECDFYRVDPLLFSPARITFCNVTTGNIHRYGELRSDILSQSFASTPEDD